MNLIPFLGLMAALRCACCSDFSVVLFDLHAILRVPHIRFGF